MAGGARKEVLIGKMVNGWEEEEEVVVVVEVVLGGG